MTTPETVTHDSHQEHHDEMYSRTVFGFWVYLLTDFVLFGALFATYLVLLRSTFGGPGPKELFSLPFVLAQTLVLLATSFIVGLAGASAHRKNKKSTIIFLLITFVLGVIFMWMELSDFARLMEGGYRWDGSAFLSAYYTLIGTHGVHMLFGLIWIVLYLIQICTWGLEYPCLQRITCLRMFWQFLNVVWVFIFSIVYLLGVS